VNCIQIVQPHLMQRAQRHGDVIQQSGYTERYLRRRDHHDGGEACARRRRKPRVSAVCGPHRRHRGQRGDREHAVVELHRRRVFKEIAPSFRFPLRPVLLGVAVQVAFESKGLNSVFPLYRFKGGNQALSSSGSTGFNLYGPTSGTTRPSIRGKVLYARPASMPAAV
jgi:hypothetical protein